MAANESGSGKLYFHGAGAAWKCGHHHYWIASIKDVAGKTTHYGPYRTLRDAKEFLANSSVQPVRDRVR